MNKIRQAGILFSRVADTGNGFQFRTVNGNWEDSNGWPREGSNLDNWRAKPAIQVVDLSPLVNSGVLCEFWNNGSVSNNKSLLESIKKDLFVDDRGSEWDNCRPLLDKYVDDNGLEWTHCRPLLNKWNVIEPTGRRGVVDGIVSEREHLASLRIEPVYMIKYTGLQDGWSWP